MPTLIKNAAGIFYIVFSKHGKRVWRSLYTCDRNLALLRYKEFEKRGVPDAVTDSEVPRPPRLDGIILREAIDEYLGYAKSNFSPSTYKDYVSVMKLVTKFFGADTPVRSITIRDIERYKAAKNNGQVSPHTVNYDLRGIKAFFNVLIKWELIDKNPCKGVNRLRTDDTIRPYLQRDELQKLLTYTAGSFLHSVIVFDILTGLRLGEIISLTWEDVLLEKRKIIVRSNGNFRTKTGKMRVLPINSELHNLLVRMPDKMGLVFKQADGKPFRGEFVSKQFKKAILECELNPKLHFHSLRHTFGSYLVEQGVSLFHVQQLMGHSSPYVTQIYAHLGSAELMSSVEKLNTGMLS
jgi:site-specific recombinase XerD